MIIVIPLLIIGGLSIAWFNPFINFKLTNKVTARLCEAYSAYSSNGTLNGCIINMANRKGDSNLCKQLNGNIAEDEREKCLASAYMGSSNIEMCESLNNNIWKGSCLYQIATNIKDENLCNRAALYYEENADFFRDSCKKEIRCKETYPSKGIDYKNCLDL